MKLILIIACYVNAILAVQKLNVLYEWKYVDYVWDSPQQKNEAIKNGEYNKEGIQMIDVDVAKDGRVFVTNLRLPGAPASVSTVTKRQGEGGPLLKPYPNWSWYKKGDCNGITSAFRVAIDACNRLYILDTGSIGVKHVCPAQILIFDLKTNELVNRIKIPDNVAQNRTGDGLLITPIVQTRGPNCALESIYLADAVGKGLVIVKSPRHQYRMESKVFEPEELYANISVAGKNFYLPDSLFGLALTTPDPKYGETEPELYLRPLASRSLYSASSKLLDLSLQGNAVGFSGNPSMMPSQATGMAFSEDGTLFFGLTKEIAIACWNRHKPMDPSNIEIVAQDDKTLQFTGTVKVVPKERSAKGCEELITLSNTYQNLATGTRKYDEVNFRILSGSVQHLVQGTKCTPPKAAFNPATPNVRRGPAYYGYYFR